MLDHRNSKRLQCRSYALFICNNPYLIPQGCRTSCKARQRITNRGVKVAQRRKMGIDCLGAQHSPKFCKIMAIAIAQYGSRKAPLERFKNFTSRRQSGCQRANVGDKNPEISVGKSLALFSALANVACTEPKSYGCSSSRSQRSGPLSRITSLRNIPGPTLHAEERANGNETHSEDFWPTVFHRNDPVGWPSGDGGVRSYIRLAEVSA